MGRLIFLRRRVVPKLLSGVFGPRHSWPVHRVLSVVVVPSLAFVRFDLDSILKSQSFLELVPIPDFAVRPELSADPKHLWPGHLALVALVALVEQPADLPLACPMHLSGLAARVVDPSCRQVPRVAPKRRSQLA